MNHVFGELFDAISMLGYWRWPVVEGEITDVLFEQIPHANIDRATIRLAVAYKFSVGNDGPYTGESFWEPVYPTVESVSAAKDKFHIGQHVPVRYRSNDPSVNRLDRRVWRDL